LRQAIKLSELTQSIQRTLEHSFSDHLFWVIADVTNHTFKFSSAVHYFELVEKDSQSSAILARMPARAWGSASGKIANFEKETGQKFENNINVLVLVSVNFSGAFGLQLNLHDIDSTYTLGHFERQRKATLDRLVHDNPGFISRMGDEYITKNKQLEFRTVIQRIAVITSATSAGYQDFVHTLKTNASGYKFDVHNYFTLVQGEANASVFVNKLIEIYASGLNFDAVVIIRGGGAQTDFLIFDNYQLSRAIAKFPIPIITGIGHHKNQTITDLMAHSVTNTPTKAAEFIIAHNRRFEDMLIAAHKRLVIKTQQVFSLHSNQLNQQKTKLLKDVFRLLHGHQRTLMNLSGSISAMPQLILKSRVRDLEQISRTLGLKTDELFTGQRNKLAHYTSLINMINPQNLLNKGFAIIMVNGRIINNAAEVQIGSELQIRMATEELTAKVTTKKKR
jgi:exodeoxyribonuclease VII large subunit